MQDYTGIHLPMITPFRKDGSLDEEGLRRVIRFGLDTQKVTGLVPCGTTGESPTLTSAEWERVISISIEEAKGRVPVIAGAGTNSTAKSIDNVRRVDALGADGVLVVGPYYNKPSMEGMVAHFSAIAKSTPKPVIIYNIPGRTSRNIEPKTIADIARANPNVLGLKDAAGSVDQTMDLIREIRGLGRKFYMLAGDDQMVFPLRALGGDGGICAVSHVVGRELVEMMEATTRGDWGKARDIHYSILPVIKALFMETNPSPLKAAMEMMGVIEPDPMRLPLVPMTAGGREKLKAVLREAGKI